MAFVLVAVVLWRIDARAFADALRGVDALAFFGFALVFSLALLTADAFATAPLYRKVAPGLRVGDVWVARARSYPASVLNHHLGQAHLTWQLARRSGVPLPSVAGATLLAYTSWSGWLAAAWVASSVMRGGEWWWWAGPVAVVGGYLLLIALAPRPLTTVAFLAPLFEAGVLGHVVAWVQRFPHFAVLFLGTWLSPRFFGVTVPFAEALTSVPLLMVVATLPVAPQGLGTRDALAAALLRQFAAGSSAEEQLAHVAAATLGWAVVLTVLQLALGLLALRLGAAPGDARAGERRPVVLYALASNGMAHATRALPMLERLSRSYEVHVFCGGPARRWLAARFERVHWIRRFMAFYVGDRVSIPLVMAVAVLTLPLSAWCMLTIGWVMVTRRPLALVTDFEALSTWTALLLRPFVKVRVVVFDNFCAARVAEPPFDPTPEERTLLRKWQGTLKAVAPTADVFLVQSVVHPTLTDSRARYVRPPIRDRFLGYAGPRSDDGPVVVCLGGTRGFDWLPEVLERSGLRCHVYGFDQAREVGAVSFRRFEDDAYLESLAHAPFSVVRGISSAYDALSLGKPILFCPAEGQFEHTFNARLFERLGVGRMAAPLTPEALRDFLAGLEPYRQRLAGLSMFDNESVYAELERAVRGA